MAMRVVAAGLSIALLCAALPVQQATAQTAPAALAAPPRSIADILAILDQEKPDPAKRAKQIAEAEAAEPAGLDARQRSRFLYERAQAAALIGRPEAALKDATLALQLAEQVGADSFRIAQLLASMTRQTGQVQEAFNILAKYGEAMDKAPAQRGRAINAYQNAAMMALEMGKLDVAEKYVGYAQTTYTELATNPRSAAGAFMFFTSWQGSIDLGKAQIAQTRGRYAEAEKHLASSIANVRDAIEKSKHWADKPPAGGMENGNDIVLAKLGETKLAQGRIVEAEVDVRQALLSILRRGGKYFGPTAQTVASLSTVMVEQGRYTDAEALSRTAVEISRGIGVDETAPQVMQQKRALANILILQRRWQDAAALYEESTTAGGSQQELARAGNRISNGRILALARTGQGPRAVEVGGRILEAVTARLGERHFDAALTRGLHGVALAAAGNDAEAVAAFRAALPVILSSSRQADTEEATSAARDFYIQTIVESYIVLLARVQGSPLAAGLDAGTESFRLADAARGRSVQRALSASAARAAVRDPALANLIREEQDVLKQIAAQFGLLSNLLALPPGQRDDKAILSLRTEVDKLRDSRAKTRQQIEKQFPEYASLIDPRPPSIEDMRATLRPGEALVSFYLAQDNSFTWVVPKDGPVSFAASPVGAAAIEQKVNRLRRALEPQAETLGDIPAFDLALAHELYRTLLQPVEAGWKPAKSLFVVSNGALGLLPLALLPTAPATVDMKAAPLFDGYKTVPWLARTHAVTQLPSSAALKTLRGLPAGSASRAPLIGFGDPFFNAEQAAEAASEAPLHIASSDPVAVRGAKLKRRNAPATEGVNSAELGMLPRLPDTADELRSVAGAMQADLSKSLYLGKAANEKTVKQAKLDGYRVVAFATHGLIPGELNGLTQPALALSAPLVADVDGDGLLTMDEILGLKLDADWVVLSACNTGTGAGAGAEAASGLGRAFFYAGTRALLLTNWSVHSASARDLVTDLFRRQAADAKLGRAEALRQAMVALLDGPGYQEDGKTLFSYGHPIFWAPYTLMGDGG
ncbi:CHAT domain-containing protein [Ferrovibrio terrae]|uniref:CHAT domain-containing protein n=1 Tax=Ferrovibrio terrae TaxID=2594003 RepID=A0A516H0Y5_9PROT|nr:CHAT domain-containing protein [Ferrovibrio terrae]QDO97432.1 CHAT domain-containing protein [Ferrovibrio terrae]